MRAVVRSGVSIAFDEICVVVVLSKRSVKALDFVGQTFVSVAKNLCSSCQGSYRSRFV